MAFFTQLEEKFYNLYGNAKGPNNQSNLEKEEQSWENQTLQLQTTLQSCAHQDSLVLAFREAEI